jgi:hypothetical protein
MDLNGHFVAAVVALVAASPNDPPVQVVKLFNTTSGNYLDGPMPKTLHSFVFGGSAAGTSTARIGTVTRSSEESTCCSPLVGPLATAAANSTAGPAVAGSISLASVLSAGAVAELVAMGFAEEAATKAHSSERQHTHGGGVATGVELNRRYVTSRLIGPVAPVLLLGNDMVVVGRLGKITTHK